MRLGALGVTWVVRGIRTRRRTRDDRRRRRCDGRRRRRRAAGERSALGAPPPFRRLTRRRSRTSIRVVAIAVLAVIATTVALVRVQRRPRLPAVLGPLQLHRLRERHRPRTSPRSRGPSTGRSSTPRTRSPPGRMAVGGRRRDRRVRHAARADAAAVLDRRPHPVDGGPLLRGVGDDAVPLHDGRDARAGAVEPGARAAVQVDRRLRPRRAVPPAAGRPLLRGVQRRREGEGRRRNPVAAPGRDRARPRRQAAVGLDDLRGRRLADGRRRSPYEPVVVDGHARRAVRGSATGEPKPAPAPGPHESEFSPWECSAVPWFNDPDALDRPLTDGGPRAWQRAPARRRARRAEAGRLPDGRGVEHPHDRRRRSSSTCRAPASR